MTKRELLDSKVFQNAPDNAKLIVPDFFILKEFSHAEHIGYDDVDNELLIC